MGSSGVENCKENEMENRDAGHPRSKRPEFYPCSDCGRKFTHLAMQIHKRSCTETEGCTCMVCKNSPKIKGWKAKAINGNDSAFKENNCGASDGENDSKVSNLSNMKYLNFSEMSIDSVHNQKFDEKEFETGIDDILDENEDDSADETDVSNTYSDHKYNVSSPSSESDQAKKSEKKSKPKYDSCEDHDGEPCNRKLFCCVCSEHVFWESFGLHVIQHCQMVENNYLKCPECDQSFSRPALLLIHFFVHVSCHPLKCAECQCGNLKCVDITSSMAEHCYAESSSFRCYICLKQFSHCQTILNHMRLHSKEMPFTCTECQRSFRQIGNLQRHMSTHRGDRPHKCPDCWRSFADPATLRNHVRVHTGETPYVCSICDRGFTQVGNLKRHMALHLQKETAASTSVSTIELISDENTVSIANPLSDCKTPDNVAVCKIESPDTTVDSDGNEEKHAEAQQSNKKKAKMKVFSCKVCKKVYAWQHDLQIHFRTHTGEKPYKCELCDKRFAQSGAVRIHKIRHHTNSSIGGSRWKKK